MKRISSDRLQITDTELTILLEICLVVWGPKWSMDGNNHAARTMDVPSRIVNLDRRFRIPFQSNARI
jgi:hypothetical protein